jgi:hypothetical protein
VAILDKSTQRETRKERREAEMDQGEIAIYLKNRWNHLRFWAFS